VYTSPLAFKPDIDPDEPRRHPTPYLAKNFAIQSDICDLHRSELLPHSFPGVKWPTTNMNLIELIPRIDKILNTWTSKIIRDPLVSVMYQDFLAKCEESKAFLPAIKREALVPYEEYGTG
jgi:hypothetical protein